MPGTECGPLHDLFDLTKAFDKVSLDGLWRIMANVCCPDKFIAMVQLFHNGMLARVQNDGEFSDPFTMRIQLIKALTSLSMIFFAMLTNACKDGENGIPFRHRFDWKLFNLRLQ